MKCYNCMALLYDGYEYPESYCGIGVPESDWIEFKDGETGCRKKSKTIKKEIDVIENEINEHYSQMGEGMSKTLEA